MWMDTKTEAKEASRNRASLRRCVLSGLLLCTGDMEHLDKYMQEKAFVLQLVVWGLRGVTRVILANNPLSGALILAALYWASPWQTLLGTLGVLASTLTAVLMGQDSAEVSGGLHGFNGMLVSLLMGVFSSAGDWYWWLLLPACLGSATCVFLSSGLSPVLERWDLPVAVFPFNIIIVLYLLCTGPDNPYFPHHPTTAPGLLEPNGTELIAVEVMLGIPLGVGQIFACGALGPSLLILGAVLLYSPLLAAHALLGSAVGTLAGLSMAVRHDSLYSGLSGFNGALGCMAVGGLFFTFSWRTHLFAIASGETHTHTHSVGLSIVPNDSVSDLTYDDVEFNYHLIFHIVHPSSLFLHLVFVPLALKGLLHYTYPVSNPILLRICVVLLLVMSTVVTHLPNSVLFPSRIIESHCKEC